jgi:hypothetical protein
MTATTVISAFPAGRGGDATTLVFEYMAAPQAEIGRLVPAGTGDLPAMVQYELARRSSASTAASATPKPSPLRPSHPSPASLLRRGEDVL